MEKKGLSLNTERKLWKLYAKKGLEMSERDIGTEWQFGLVYHTSVASSGLLSSMFMARSRGGDAIKATAMDTCYFYSSEANAHV